ncbi:hypothetical protein D039_3913A, partial [Vibrio parahaemolyticus EKP-028]
MTSNLH